MSRKRQRLRRRRPALFVRINVDRSRVGLLVPMLSEVNFIQIYIYSRPIARWFDRLYSPGGNGWFRPIARIGPQRTGAGGAATVDYKLFRRYNCC